MMFHQQHTGTASADRGDQPTEALDLVGGQARRRFVQQQEHRMQHQGARDFHEPQFTVLEPVGAYRRERLQSDHTQRQRRLRLQRQLVAPVARQTQQ